MVGRTLGINNIDLYVPEKSVDLYKSDEVWGKFNVIAYIDIEELYATAINKIDVLSAKFQDAIVQINNNYPVAADSAQVVEAYSYIKNSIAVMSAAVESSYEKGTLAADKDSIFADYEIVKMRIEEMLEYARKIQEAYDKAEAEEAANREAAEKLDQRYSQVSDYYYYIIEVIEKECPDVKDHDEIKALKEQIIDKKGDIKTLINDSYVAGTCVADTPKIEAEFENLENLILSLWNKAEHLQKAHNEAEAMKANDDAYKAVMEKIVVLQTKYNSVVNQIDSKYPEIAQSDDVIKRKTEIMVAIKQLENTVDKAYDAMTLVAEMDSILSTCEDIEKTINALQAYIIEVGINAVSIDSEKIIGIYDLNGKKLSSPQRGLNIIRMNDGTVKKVRY